MPLHRLIAAACSQVGLNQADRSTAPHSLVSSKQQAGSEALSTRRHHLLWVEVEPGK